MQTADGYIAQGFGKVPTLTASMSLGRDFFDLGRVLDIRTVLRFRDYLKGVK